MEEKPNQKNISTKFLFQSSLCIHFEDPSFEFSKTSIALSEICNILFLNLDKLLKIYHVMLFQNQLECFRRKF